MTNSLKNWRIERSLTLEAAATLLSVSLTAWRNWEEGLRSPSGDNLRRLRDLTGLSYEQIMEPAPTGARKPRAGSPASAGVTAHAPADAFRNAG